MVGKRFELQNANFKKVGVKLVMECITSVVYTSIDDSYDSEPIMPVRGLRQGGPLSPYLFIICAEGLSCLLTEKERLCYLHDDCYLFFRASQEEVESVKGILAAYELLSGQKVNFHKTSILFSSNATFDKRAPICDILGVVEVNDQGKYLGLSSLVGRNKKNIFQFIRDRVSSKIKWWNSKVFKAKYFPNSNFLNAKLGSNLSFVWRSIFATQQVTRKGARVRIGDGRSTSIWADLWLLNEKSGDIPDSWIWVLDKKHKFSVKSIYRCLRGEVVMSVADDSSGVWNRIWNLHIALCVRNFLWRVTACYLPTFEALALKNVFINAVCCVCNSRDESTVHLFADCEMAVKSWRAAKLVVPTDWNGHANYMGDQWQASETYESNLKEQVKVIELRSGKSLDNPHVTEVVQVDDVPINSEDEMAEIPYVNALVGHHPTKWQGARGKLVGSREEEFEEGDGVLVWQPGWFKVNVDTALFDRKGSVGRGCAVRDEGGRLVCALRIEGNFDARTDEGMGIREALSWLKDWSNLIEADALDVVLDIRNSNGEGGELLIDDCATLAKQFSKLFFVYVRRSANLAAHCLARNARSMSGHRKWFSNFPKFLTSVNVSI
ncbi:uncharacterized protein LOC126672674 [Mercurialis annua]|uniref:uncharacterized protein LOC126672674 n=1 Tax=Mercurialis annua TaxID=3986 RepID=UPI00215F2F12|nr:uncharacterized protein LOC126672674 [Mercurialis annua]